MPFFGIFRNASALPAILLAVYFLLGRDVDVKLFAADVRIESVEHWSNVFDGEEIVQRFRIPNAAANAEAIGWRVTMETAVINRGESVLKADPNLGPLLTVQFRLPEGGPRVILSLTIHITRHGQEVLAKRLWIFPRNPFTQPIPGLGTREIVLFDPQRTTAPRLEEADVQFRLVKHVDALAELRGGVLLIGHGTNFREHRALSSVVLQVANRGVTVVCLAPSAGVIPFPDDEGSDGQDESKSAVLQNFRLGRTDVIAAFDKRLDFRDWRGKSSVIASTFKINGKDKKMTAEVSTENRGWSWIEADFANRGRLIVCGFNIMEQWDAGPAPRHTLWHLLAHAVRETKAVDQ